MTVIGIQVGVLLGGAIIVETLFALPGVGRLLVTAITQRNYPTVQVGVLAIATIFILVSLVTDLIVGWLDPRVAGRGGAMSAQVAASPRQPPSGADQQGSSRGLIVAGAAACSASSSWSRSQRPCSPPTTRRRSSCDQVLAAPSAEHLFGSDVLGRDVLSRVIYGLRVSLLVSHLRGRSPRSSSPCRWDWWRDTSAVAVDTAVSRTLDMILVLPAMLLAITFIAILGPGSVVAAVAIAVIYLPILGAGDAHQHADRHPQRVRRRRPGAGGQPPADPGQPRRAERTRAR